MLFVAAIIFGLAVVALACRVTAEAGHQANRMYIDQDGQPHLNGAQLYLDESGQTLRDAAAEVVTAANVITAAENGKTFFLDLAAGFTSTLPAPALGLKFRFVVKTAPTGAAYVIATNASGNVMFGMMVERAGGAGVAGSAEDTFSFIHNQSIPGDWVEFESDGTNWYYHGMTDVAAGSTATQAS